MRYELDPLLPRWVEESLSLAEAQSISVDDWLTPLESKETIRLRAGAELFVGDPRGNSGYSETKYLS